MFLCWLVLWSCDFLLIIVFFTLLFDFQFCCRGDATLSWDLGYEKWAYLNKTWLCSTYFVTQHLLFRFCQLRSYSTTTHYIRCPSLVVFWGSCQVIVCHCLYIVKWNSYVLLLAKWLNVTDILANLCIHNHNMFASFVIQCFGLVDTFCSSRNSRINKLKFKFMYLETRGRTKLCWTCHWLFRSIVIILVFFKTACKFCSKYKKSFIVFHC